MSGNPPPLADGRANGVHKASFVDPRLVIVPRREDVDYLRGLGFEATCFDDLRGVAFRRVVVWWNASDAYVDEYARRTLDLASRDGQGAISVHALEVVAAERHSIRDVVAAAGYEPEEIRGELDGAVPFVRRATTPGDGVVDYSVLSRSDLGITSMSAIDAEPIEWIWPYRLARREMALVAGEGGLGKSQVLLKIAAAVSRGLPWPDGSGVAPLGRVVVLSAEDDPATTIKPRLMAMEADASKIDLLRPQVVIRKPGEVPRVSHKSFQDVDHWERVLDRIGDVVLFIVDPLPSYLGRGVNDSKNNELRETLEPFIDRVIRPRGIGLLSNSHLNKSTNSRTPMERILGSVAYGNLARNVSFVARDPDDPARRFFKQAKCNTADENLPAMAFRIEKRTVHSVAGIEIETAVPVFEDGTVEVDLDAALSGEKGKRRGPAPVKTTKLAEWLVELMRGKGPMFLGAIADAAGQADFLGSCEIDAAGKSRWSMGLKPLYRAKDMVPTLPDPNAGWVIDTPLEDPDLRGINKSARWMLRLADSPY